MLICFNLLFVLLAVLCVRLSHAANYAVRQNYTFIGKFTKLFILSCQINILSSNFFFYNYVFFNSCKGCSIFLVFVKYLCIIEPGTHNDKNYLKIKEISYII